MKYPTISSSIAGLLLVASNVVEALPFSSSSKGVVQFAVSKDSESSSPSNVHSFAQTSKYINQTLDSRHHVAYFLNITVGTPAQEVTVQLDTGSSDTWFFKSGIGYPDHVSFKANESSTYKFISSTYNASYSGGEVVHGDWITDTVSLQGFSIPSQQVAMVTGGEVSPVGILGVGRVELETDAKPAPYPNVPASLYDLGYINRNAYSLYLDDLDSPTGTLLFGGVDTAKYSGQLYTVPLVASASLKVNATLGNITFRALLDSGASYMYVPQEMFDLVATALDAKVKGGSMYIDEIPNQAITFMFSGAPIAVPISQIVVPGRSAPGKYQVEMVVTDDNDFIIFGDSFLRNAYVVYDITRKEVSLAQAVFTSRTSVVPIPATGPIPGSIPAPGLQSSDGGGLVGSLL